MPETTFKSTAHLQEGVQVKVRSRNFEITVDEPESLGGKDTGMNPVELVLSALGACQAICAASFAKKFDMTFNDFWVEVEGDLDTDGFMGISDVRKGYSEIRYNIHIDTEEPREKVEKFVAFVEETCPVGDTIANPVTMKLNDIIIESGATSQA
ncbi:OsmC family protein [Texcoconibacillus texcoconensis]|uniref:Putative OsmC-like protein n=1 Tax=Texcoconibacillus texcoconensis TaxID=1095777 RepID=A0A840QGT3_9BACI|nr:OsmC family protein [Texcoconibacillus texcoconensis]MBB5171862.1 putative OsmC-like protein [Texcoconibacillus texcoconensis]